MAARATRAKLLIEITLPNLSSKFLFEVSLRNFSLKFLFEISLIIATVIFSRSPCTSATFPKKTRGEGFIWREGANALRLLFMKITCYFHARRYHAHLIFYWCLYDKKINLTRGWCMILFSTERLHRKFECTTVCPANHSILRQSSGIHHPHIHLGCTTSENEKLSVFY